MSKLKKFGYICILAIVMISISACQKATPTMDLQLKITEIAATVQAEITQKAALTPSATPTLEPTATATEIPPTATLSAEMIPTATNTEQAAVSSGSDTAGAAWVADVTIPDGKYIKPGDTFVKTWRIRNTGKTTWPTAYYLTYFDGLQGANGVLTVHLPRKVKPEETVDVSVTFTAPKETGTYYSYWRLATAEREPFGERMSMKIYVYPN